MSQHQFPWGQGYLRDVYQTYGKLPKNAATYERALEFRTKEIEKHASICEDNKRLYAENNRLRADLQTTRASRDQYSNYLTQMLEERRANVDRLKDHLSSWSSRTRSSNRDAPSAAGPSEIDRSGPRADAPRQASELNDARRHERRGDSERREELPCEAVSEGSA